MEGYFPGYSLAGYKSQLNTACKLGWRIAAGAFQESVAADPPAMPGDCKDNWLVLGGANVGNDGHGHYPNSYTAGDVVNWMKKYHYNSVDFDAEGVLDPHNNKDSHAQVLDIIDGVKAEFPDAKFQYTIIGSFPSNDGEFGWLKQNHEKIDTIALMMYGQAMNGNGWELNDPNDYESQDTWGWLKTWIDDKDIPNEKIMVGITWAWQQEEDHPDHGKLTPGWVINSYKQLVADEKLKGMFIWNAGQSPFEAMGQCLSNMEVPCDNGYPEAEGCNGPTCPTLHNGQPWICTPGKYPDGDNECGAVDAHKKCHCTSGEDTR